MAKDAREDSDGFEGKWGKNYPAIGRLWRERLERVNPPYVFPPEIRKAFCTTNAVESLHRFDILHGNQQRKALVAVA